jgi:vacuolar iron transporter family protein
MRRPVKQGNQEMLSGVDIKRRVRTNLFIITAAVGMSFAIGIVTKRVWGVSV